MYVKISSILLYSLIMYICYFTYIKNLYSLIFYCLYFLLMSFSISLLIMVSVISIRQELCILIALFKLLNFCQSTELMSLSSAVSHFLNCFLSSCQMPHPQQAADEVRYNHCRMDESLLFIDFCKYYMLMSNVYVHIAMFLCTVKFYMLLMLVMEAYYNV